jgi:hypothetical protein
VTRRDPVIHICVRQTLDWRDEALVDARVFPWFRPKLLAWNATFDMPYHVFRQRLKTIAEQNLARVEGCVRTALEAVPRGDLIVPVDDDDWLAPDLGMELRRALDDRAHGYLWRREVIEAPPLWRRAVAYVGRLIGRRELHTCKTNSYAVVNRPGLGELALDHVRASEHFDAHAGDIRRIPATLALQNRNLASQTALHWERPPITQAEMLAVYRRIYPRYRRLYDSLKLDASLSWARPCVDQMADLMREIRPR